MPRGLRFLFFYYEDVVVREAIIDSIRVVFQDTLGVLFAHL